MWWRLPLVNFVVIVVTCTIDLKNIRTVLVSLPIVSRFEYQHVHRLVLLSILLIGSPSEPKRGDVVYVTLTGYNYYMYYMYVCFTHAQLSRVWIYIGVL